MDMATCLAASNNTPEFQILSWPQAREGSKREDLSYNNLSHQLMLLRSKMI